MRQIELCLMGSLVTVCMFSKYNLIHVTNHFSSVSIFVLIANVILAME